MTESRPARAGRKLRDMMQRRDFLHAGAHAALATVGASRLSAAPWTTLLPHEAPDGGGAADRMQWWREARFGMFVHWGLYAILAGEWGGRTDFGEWIRNNAKIPLDEYDTLRSRWQPAAFDADAMARLARRAGMRYLVITTKHHDGFALWPSKHGDFNVSRAGDSRDIMRAVADACRRHDVVPCWYHSIMDWHHPDYLPRRDWESGLRPQSGAHFARYVQFLHDQVEELLTQYGDIGVMWFDGEWESTWTQELGIALAEKCRALQPHVIVNNRVAPNRAGMNDPNIGKIGDFGTPEQNIPDRGLPGVDWESCITMNRNWGYNQADHDFKSVPQLVSMLIDTASKGGNLLLNIGPMASGAIPPESIDRLQGLARWMDVHGDAIHATSASPFASAPFKATQSPGGDRINVFLPSWPGTRDLLLPGLTTLPSRVTLMGRSSLDVLPARLVDTGVVVTLPTAPADAVCSVVRVEARERLRVR